MAKKILVAALILILFGLMLVLYQDPQMRLVFTPIPSGTTGRSFAGNSGTNAFAPGIGSLATSGTSLAFDSTAIVESLLGAGLAGIGLVLVVVEILTGSLQRAEVQEAE